MKNRLGILTAIVASLGSVSTGDLARSGTKIGSNPKFPEWHGGKHRPWRNRDSMFYGMTGKAYRRLERKLRREMRLREI